MNVTTLSSRARSAAVYGAAGITALAGTLTASGSVSAARTNPSAAGVPRLDLLAPDVWCYQGDLGSVTFSYDDLADGHVPQAVHEEVSDGSSVVWTRDDLYQENGNYFNIEVFSYVGGTMPFDRNATVTYTVTMTYDDGITQSQSTSLDVGAQCTGTAPPTVPPTSAPSPEPDRFQLTEGLFGCGTASGAFLEWTYGDYADGHYAARFDIDLLRNGVAIEHHATTGGDPSSDGAVALFDVRPDAGPGAALDPFFDSVTLQPASYSLSITVTYEDGATDKHIDTFNLDDLCDGRVNGQTAPVPTTAAPTTSPSNPGATTTTTTVPSGTLPETGSGNLTWVIGAVAGLLMTAGAALFAGVRRSRIG